jgi:hypothetical protein
MPASYDQPATEPSPLHLATMRECISIRRQQHAAWKGDPVRNAEGYCFDIGHLYRERGEYLLRDLRKFPTAYSAMLGIPVSAVERYANRVEEGIKSSHISECYRRT